MNMGLSVFTEKLYSKSLERRVVYIPITISSHATSLTSKNSCVQSDLTSALFSS